MWFLCLILSAALAYADEPKPLQFTPDQIVLSLRTTKPPMPPADCAALSVFACKLEFPMPVRDISIRWIQLDDDPELGIAGLDSERMAVRRWHWWLRCA